MDTEEKIYKGLVNDEDWAMSAIYTKYYDSTTAFLSRNGANPQDKDDVFQEAMIVFIRQIEDGSYNFVEGSMGGYIRKLVQYSWYNFVRRKPAVSNIDDALEEIPTEGDEAIYRLFEREENKRKFDILIKMLSEDCKVIILGRYKEEVPEKVLAKKLKLSVGYLKVKRNRCLNALKEKILKKSA